MANRVALQATQTVIPLEVFLRRECHRYRITDMDLPDSQPPVDHGEPQGKASRGILQPCRCGKADADVLHRHLQFP